MQGRYTAMSGVVLMTAMLMTGCHVDEHKHNGREDVKIDTPFGNVSVKTSDGALAAGTGIDVYPGAVPVKKDGKDGDKSSADVSMSFGSFSLKVMSAAYHTPDAPDKVIAFYRNGLTKFGAVIECSQHDPVGSATQTQDGLTCGDDKGKHLSLHGDPDKVELKTGSKQHQHVVSIDKDSTGTKIGLVAIDLPGKLDSGEDSERDEPKAERKQ